MFNETDGMGGSWAWFLILILALFGGFGGMGKQGNTATSAEVYDATNIQSTTNRLNEIVNGIDNINYNMANQTNAIQQSMNTGFNSVNTSINNLSHQLDACCCNLRSQMLQDKYDDVRNQLNLAQLASSNAVQTQNLLNTLGNWYSKPSVNPYYAYGYNNGTTIA